MIKYSVIFYQQKIAFDGIGRFIKSIKVDMRKIFGYYG